MEELRGRPRNPLKWAKRRYNDNRKRQIAAGNEFKITFEDWYAWWLAQGVEKNVRHTGPMLAEYLCMTRIDRNRPFELGNIMATTQGKSNLGIPSRSYGRPRPQVWIEKDPIQHKKYEPWLRFKAQCAFRDEECDITFEDWKTIWPDELWAQRGRHADNLAMTREDPEGAWTLDNVIIVTRREQLQRASAFRQLVNLRKTK